MYACFLHNTGIRVVGNDNVAEKKNLQTGTAALSNIVFNIQQICKENCAYLMKV